MEKVKFTIAGPMFNSYDIKTLESRDLSKLSIPQYCFQIDFYTVVNSRAQNKQSYKIGKVLTLSEVNTIYGTNSPAHRNMKRMVKSHETPFLGAAGNLTIIKKTDNVLDPTKLNYPSHALADYKSKLLLLTMHKSF